MWYESLYKKIYSDIKNILKVQGYNTKYFTYNFFRMFVCSWRKREENIKNNILLFHCYDPVYDSKFYNLNSCTYCEFLSIFHSWQKE